MKRKFYTPSADAGEITRIALFWWSEELTEKERKRLRIAATRLVERCRGLGEVGIAELWFKLRLMLPDSEFINE